MLRVILALIIIAFWLPIVIILYSGSVAAAILYGVYSFLIALFVCVPLTIIYINFKRIKLYQFMFMGSIFGAGWGLLFSSPHVKLNTLILFAVVSAAYSMLYWILAFWNNNKFIP